MLDTNLLPVSQVLAQPQLDGQTPPLGGGHSERGRRPWASRGLLVLKVMLFVCYRSDFRVVSDFSRYLTDQRR